MRLLLFTVAFSFLLAVTVSAGVKIEGASVNDYTVFTELIIKLSKTTTFTVGPGKPAPSLELYIDGKLKKFDPPATAGLVESVAFEKQDKKTLVTLILGPEAEKYEGYIQKKPPAVVIKIFRRLPEKPPAPLGRIAAILNGQKILLVDDDDGPGNGNAYGIDVERYYAEALDELGVEYDLYTIKAGKSGPTAGQMNAYPLVIWFNGLDARPVVLSEADKSSIKNYVSAGGKAFLVSQNLLSDSVNPAGLFHKEVLGINSYKADTQVSKVKGTGTPYAEKEYDLGGEIRPIGNWGDGMKPGSGVALLEGADGYAYGVANRYLEGRIVFVSVALENAPGITQIAELLDAALIWLVE